MAVELRHLRHFIALAEEGHFGRAAERVFVVQQALSSSIRTLEDELGVKLVLRTTRRVQLTPAGEVFLTSARTTLNTLAQGTERARQAARGEVGASASASCRGWLSVGCQTSCGVSGRPTPAWRWTCVS